jgi:ribose 5-phosphate isomerase B
MEKIFIASDHGGFELKSILLEHKFPSFQLEDLGPASTESVDYPDFAKKLCEKVLATHGSRGILICGTGQGMAMQANRFKGIRAALCWSTEIAKLSRDHNNANVLCLGGRVLSVDQALHITSTWLSTPFSGGRHHNRINKLDQI